MVEELMCKVVIEFIKLLDVAALVSLLGVTSIRVDLKVLETVTMVNADGLDELADEGIVEFMRIDVEARIKLEEAVVVADEEIFDIVRIDAEPVLELE